MSADRQTHTHTSINVLQLVSPQGTFQYKFITTNDIMTLTEVKCNASQIMQIEGFDTIFMPAKQRGMYGICQPNSVACMEYVHL